MRCILVGQDILPGCHSCNKMIASICNQKGFVFRYMFVLLSLCSVIARIDPIDRKNFDTMNKNEKLVRLKKSWKSYIKSSKFWSTLIFFVYLLCQAHSCAYLAIHYWYDYNSYQLRYFHQLEINTSNVSNKNQSKNDPQPMSMVSMYQEIKANIDWAKRTLPLIGGPNEGKSFIMEICYLIIILCSYLIYVYLSIHHRLFGLYNCYAVRDILNPKGEEKRTNELINTLIEQVSISGEQFYQTLEQTNSQNLLARQCTVEISREYQYQAKNQTAFRSVNRFSMFNIQDISTLSGKTFLVADKNEVNRSKFVEMNSIPPTDCYNYDNRLYLKQLHSTSALTPFNRNPHWREVRVLAMFITYNISLIYGAFFISFMMSILDEHEDRSQNSSEFVYYLTRFEYAYMSSLVIISGSIYTVGTIIRIYDQILLVRRLRQLLDACRRINSNIARCLIFTERSSKESSIFLSIYDRNRALFRSLNINLLLVLMHYKIFVAQMNNGVRDSFKIVHVNVAILISIPIIIRLHLPYMDQDASSRDFALKTSYFVLIPANFVLVPLCHLFSRCMDLNKSLAYLLAHTIETDLKYSQQGSSSGHCHPDATLYNAHNVTLLRRELNHPERLKSRVAVMALGMSFTYTLLCRLLFWYGFIMLSIIHEKQFRGMFNGFLT